MYDLSINICVSMNLYDFIFEFEVHCVDCCVNIYFYLGKNGRIDPQLFHRDEFVNKYSIDQMGIILFEVWNLFI